MGKHGGYPGGMPGNMSNLMKQAQRMQKQMEEQQKEFEEKLFAASAGGGAVAAFNEALKKMEEENAGNMNKLAGGLGSMGIGGLF